MFSKIKQKIERNLIEEIKHLSATDLEQVGNYLLSVLEGKQLVHHGTNKEGRPCGYTVDSFSQDATIVGEYSVEKDYFANYSKEDGVRCYRKIHKDIQHAIAHSGENLIKIYLVTSQEEIPSFRKEFNKTKDFIDNIAKLAIYDAKLLAQEIYKQSLESVSHLQFYKEYFPNFAQELENYEYYGKIPSLCDNFCEDISVLDKIEVHFQKGNNICLLYGMSGSGKTQAAINYVHYKSSEFQNYVWIAGEDWKRNTSLSAVQRSRGGMPINVVGLFNKSKTILIIDSFEREVNVNDFSELSEGFAKGGKVIITSQIKSSGEFCMQMPELSESVAISILGETRNEGIVKKIINKCKGFPIILSTIRNMVLYEGIAKDDLYVEIMKNPAEVITEGGVSLYRSVLSKLSPKTREQLVKLANTGITTFDISFARFYCGILSCNTLQKLSILMTTNVPGIVKIHDLICVAMKEEDDASDAVIKLEEYIESKNGEMTPSILRQIYLLRYKIVDYKAEHSGSDWLTYALLQIEGDEKDKIVEAIFEQQFVKEMSLSMVMCLIEAKELRGYKIHSREEVEEYFDKLIAEYQNALRLYTDMDIKTELLHHLGKAYRRRNRSEDSYKCFKELLEFKPNWHATYGQIVTLGTMKVSKEIVNDAKCCMRKLLVEMLDDAAQVPLRVSLATIAKMRSYREVSNELVNSPENVERICQIVASAAIEDIGQFFEGFVAISTMYGYHYSKICLSLAESVPDMIMVSPKMVEDKQWLNACEALANIAVAAQSECKQELFDMLIDKSIEFGEAYLANKKIRSYEARAIAKSFIVRGEGQRALDIINMIPEEGRDHWLMYRQAEAENMLGDNKSIETAKKAIELLEEDPKSINRKSSYYHLLSKCYYRNAEIKNACEMIEIAIRLCCDPKYEQELIECLKDMNKAKEM